MCKKVVALGLSVLGIAGCTGSSSDTWLSATNVELYENHQGTAYQAIFSSADGASTRYSLAGDDAPLFTIDAQSGELYFKQAPDYEAPQDYTGDNIYSVTVAAASVTSGEQRSSINVSIHVKDAERLQATQYFPLPNSYVEPNQNGVVPLTVAFEGQGAPIFYPDEWQILDQDITRFFKYYAFGIEPSYSEERLAYFLDSKQFYNASLPTIQLYMQRRFNNNIINPALLDYGYTINPDNKIAVIFSSVNKDQPEQIELEWALQEQINDIGRPLSEIPSQIAIGENQIYFSNGNTIWRISREGKHLTRIYSSETTPVIKLSMVNGRLFILLHNPSLQSWHLMEWTSDDELAELYKLPKFNQQLFGDDFDVEVLSINSSYEVVFLPSSLCDAENNAAIEPALYRFSESGFTLDKSLLTNSTDPIFNCKDGHLVDRNLSFDLEYSSPQLSYIPNENSLYFWGRSFTEDNINGVSMSSGPESVTIGTQYWFDESADYISNFQHYSRHFDKRKSFYIKDSYLYVADGNIDSTSTRISSDNYQVYTYAIDAVADLIYSVGLWGNAQTPVLAVHHFYSGATSYIPLMLDTD